MESDFRTKYIEERALRLMIQGDVDPEEVIPLVNKCIESSDAGEELFTKIEN